jgi:hypothetical protein
MRSSALRAAILLLPAAPASAAFFHDWTGTFSGSGWTYTNTSYAGTTTGFDPHPAFAAQPGTWGVPYAITTQTPFTCEFQIHGTTALGSSVDFSFSSGYAWGSGGELLIGNIHNYYEYTLEAWDFSSNQIDVNTWLTINEYPSSAPGTIGYFSTSSTTRTAAGLASKFFVFDPNVDPNLGQGGVVHVGGLANVGKIRLTLTSSSLAPNAQQVDFILFNVGTPIPAPGALGAAAVGVVLATRRRRA